MDDTRRDIGRGDRGAGHNAVLVDNGAVDDTIALRERIGRRCQEDRERTGGEARPNALSSHHVWLLSDVTIRVLSSEESKHSNVPGPPDCCTPLLSSQDGAKQRVGKAVGAGGRGTRLSGRST